MVLNIRFIEGISALAIGDSNPTLPPKNQCPDGALIFCGESEHARGWDSKRRACKRDAGRIPYQMFVERIRSDEQASGVQGVSSHNDQRQKEKAPLGALFFCGESKHARRWHSKRGI